MHSDATRILLAADGFLKLGMLDHAARELDEAPVEAGSGEHVLALRCRIFMVAWE